MGQGPILSCEALAGRLQHRDQVLVDCRFDLGDPDAGYRAYLQARIPGARYAHLDHDLAGPREASSGRHPLPDVVEFARTLARWGIGAATPVIAYDDQGGAMAARLWWLLRWAGHRRAAVLDGGFGEWCRLELPLEVGQASATETPVPQLSPDDGAWISTRNLRNALAGEDILLVDARAAPRFRGEQEPIDPVAGHVPGAVNHPFSGNLDERGCFLSPERLREAFARLLAGRSPETVVHMCGSGVTACQNLLAMEAAGLSGSRLYVGSWSEWIRDAARPVATGPV